MTQDTDIKDVKHIRTASIPIIKLQLGAKYEFRKVDITFQTYYHNGIKCNALIKEYINKEPHLKPLVIVLKKLLYCNNMHDTYTGGLGSYSLVLLVVALLQVLVGVTQSTTVNKKS